MAIHFFSFCLSEKWFSLHFLKYIFTEFKILSWQIFLSVALQMPHYCFLAYIVLTTCLLSFFVALFVIFPLFLPTFNILSLILIFGSFVIISLSVCVLSLPFSVCVCVCVCTCVCFCSAWIYSLLSFIRGKFSVIISLSIHIWPCFLFPFLLGLKLPLCSTIWYCPTVLGCSVFVTHFFFSLSVSVWIISIDEFLRSLPLYSCVSCLIISPSWELSISDILLAFSLRFLFDSFL